MNSSPTVAETAHALGEIYIPQRSSYQKAILFALPLLKKHVYEGTVTAATKASRRAANKAARVARRHNRRAA